MPSVSKSQQRLMGQVHACQKYGSCSSEKVKDIATHIKPKDAEDFARTKHKGLPEKVEKKKNESFESWLKYRDPKLHVELVENSIMKLEKLSGIDLSKYDKKQIAMGMEEELEHKDITKNDKVKTLKIVLAHLKEDPKYYTKLKKCI